MDLVTGAREIAKDVLTGAVGSLISKLGNLLKEEYKLHKSAPDKLVTLIKELESAHAALSKLDGEPPDQLDEQVKIWAREIRDASYDMEDEIDTFFVEVIGGHQERRSAGQESLFQRLHGYIDGLSGTMRNLFKRRKMYGAIDDINKRLEDVTQRHGRYTVHNITVARSAASSGVDPRLAAMYNEVTQLVGIDKSSSDLVSSLKTAKMVSVVGVGGLGKTTLAKSVYDKLKMNFECSAFVPVGQNPDLKKVFRDILIEINKSEYLDPKMTMLDERQLIDELRENLEHKRYLLVIDDIWEAESWVTIKLALVQKNSVSRVITTTRILEVAKHADEIYKLQHLPYDKSKKLFYMRIFGGEGKCPDSQLDEVSNKILKKCDGVPLAIMTMASLLVGKSRKEWIKVCSSFAFRDKYNKQVSDMEWILSLSYDDLPPHLKTCLLYLSVFPEDELIHKDSLIWKWVAEGFVPNDKPGTGLFDVGNGYFNELINRSMIQAVELEVDVNKLIYGNMIQPVESEDVVIGCRVHDMVLHLLRLKSQEENFVTISSNNVGATSTPNRVRRLTHQNIMVKHSQMDMGHVRSFICLRSIIDKGFSFQKFKLLRVLALENCGGYNTDLCLKHIGNLFHLRYIGLRNSCIQEIPDEIGSLKFLQTMDLKGVVVKNKNKWLLPLTIGLLTNLICLSASFMWAPNGVLKQLTSLEHLEISAHKDFVKELGKLRELRFLNAYIELDLGDELEHSIERDLAESFSNLHKIWNLELKLNRYIAFQKTVALPRTRRRLIVPHIYLSELPSYICPSDLPNLTDIDLSVDYMKDQHLKVLGQLPELRHLKLKISSPDNVAKLIVNTSASASTITNGCFLKLKSLSLPDSAVQFVLTSYSSTLFVYNIYGRGMDFDTKRRDKCIVPAASLMPDLRVLQFKVYWMDGFDNGICDNLGLDCLPSLQSVYVTFSGALFTDDVVRVKAAMRQAIEDHPNQPAVQTHIIGQSYLRRFQY